VTIGTITYSPSGRFAFPRSYVYGIAIGRYGDTITQVANEFTIHAVPPDPSFAVLRLDPRFWLWSSNRWTLDHVITDWYVDIGGIPPHVPLTGTLSWQTNHLLHRAMLRFDWYITDPDYEFFSFYSQPLNYWLPKPLP